MKSNSNHRAGEAAHPAVRAWKRMAARIRDRRRVQNAVGHKRRVENRFLPSLYEIWRMLAGTHESSPK